MTMPVNKVTIAVSGELLRDIDREAEARGMSRSQWMSYATTATLERDLLLRSIDKALEETGGPITTAEVTEAERKLSRLLKRSKKHPSRSTSRLPKRAVESRKSRAVEGRQLESGSGKKGRQGAA
jgi:metal-responsive CopG/Arc/MetJ family transcriptional regulator